MSEKLISFCVPCYNSEKDMRKCLDSLLTQKDKVEIIIIDDGSKDSTPQIVDEYANKYPECVIGVHQPNGGHGAGINKALSLATGKFFKVVDSDDWVDQKGYEEVLKRIEIDGDKIDLFIMNYAYFYVDSVKKIIKFNGVFKPNKVLKWNNVKRFMAWEYLTLHSVMYKREVLKRSNVTLPEHTFYEDNYFIYASLPYVNTLYYIPMTFYMYFIGRVGQSVGIEQMKKRFKDHYLIAHLMNNEYDVFQYKKTNKRLYRTLMHHLILINSIGFIYTRLNGTKEGLEAYRNLKQEVKTEHPRLYKKLKYFSMCGFVMCDGVLGTWLMRFSLWFARRVVPFC